MRQNGLAELAHNLVASAVKQYGQAMSSAILDASMRQSPELAGLSQGSIPADMAIVILPGGKIQVVSVGVGPQDHGLDVEVGTVELMDRLIPYGTSTTYPMHHMMDVRGADLALIMVNSSCNAALTIQAIGHFQDAPTDTNGRVNLGGGVTIADGSATVQRSGISVVRRDYPYPWLGVTVASGAAPPTTGEVQVFGYFERWPSRVSGR